MKRYLVCAILVAACAASFAKLPPLDDAAKAKAAEAASKAAWQAKVDGFQLCKAQDKVAAQYMKTAGRNVPAKDAKLVATAATAATSAAPATAPAAPAAATAAAAQPPAAAASGTPVLTAAAPLPPCNEPGPYASNPVEQKPLETSGAHSPTGTAASPPSVKPDSAAMAPKK
ncbi:MAG: hypothetical protein H0X13_06010 [Ramlibacter sp.]|nr:hypothetical protein [Ramlibacter sp.]